LFRSFGGVHHVFGVRSYRHPAAPAQLVEHAPATLSEAEESCQAQGAFATSDGEAFRAAVTQLLCRGLIRPDGESLAITIAGRVALSDYQLA
jgi:hypothetical protein